MSYPMKEIRVDNGNSSPMYREMTPQEYEKALHWYRIMTEAYLLSSSRLEQDYGSYLKRWFSDNECDGYISYEVRYRLHKLPQTFNGYCFE